MLSIRFSRVGKKKAPIYRIVVMPKNRDPWADNLEILGHYNPRRQPREVFIKEDRVRYWLDQGAQASDSVWNLLVDENIVDGKKRNVTHLTKKRTGKLEEKVAEEKEAKEKAEAEAKEAKEAEKAEEESKKAEEKAAAEEQPAEEKTESVEEPAAEAPAEETKEDSKTEESEKKEETPEEKKDESSDDTSEEKPEESEEKKEA